MFGASLTATAITNASGVATLPLFTANTVAGAFTLHANLGAVSTNFSLTNVAGAVTQLTIQSGDNQSTAIATAYPVALSVLAADVYGNPVSGASIAFNMPGSGASAAFPGPLSSTLAITNAAGVATAPTPLTANAVVGALINPNATIGAISATFKLTNLTGSPASISITAGNNQSTLVGTPSLPSSSPT